MFYLIMRYPILISSSGINRINTQADCNYSDENLFGLAFGNRFAYFIEASFYFDYI